MNLKRHIQNNYPGEKSGIVEKPEYGKIININGKDIFYTEKGSGPPIVYIHGNLGSHKWFSSVMDIDRFRTIALDLPNFGFSDRIESCEISEYSLYVSSFIKALNLVKPIVAGHSLGGAVAMAVAVETSTTPGRLVLIDSSSIQGLVTPKESYPVIEMYKNDYFFLKQALSAIMPGVSDENRINELVDSALMMKTDAYLGHADALSRFDLTDKADKVPFPLLFLRGVKDILITHEMAEKTIDILGGEILEVDDIGHSLIVEDPSGFVKILKGFIS